MCLSINKDILKFEISMDDTLIMHILNRFKHLFKNNFDFVETPDQLEAIIEIEEDLASGKPMDRLICGDVGFGKTEVAMRAAFIVASTNYDYEK